MPKILGELCSGEMTPTQHLETQQALVKQFAEILEFVLKFDEHKVSESTFCSLKWVFPQLADKNLSRKGCFPRPGCILISNALHLQKSVGRILNGR